MPSGLVVGTRFDLTAVINGNRGRLWEAHCDPDFVRCRQAAPSVAPKLVSRIFDARSLLKLIEVCTSQLVRLQRLVEHISIENVRKPKAREDTDGVRAAVNTNKDVKCVQPHTHEKK